MSSPGNGPVRTHPLAGVDPDRRREQKAWSFYDWANSAYFTTVLSVLFAPYMATVAGRAAGCGEEVEGCGRTLDVLGLAVSPGSLPFYLTSFATIASALLLPIVGAVVDRSRHRRHLLAGFAWSGSACAALLFLMTGDAWQIGAVAVVLSSVLAGCSLVVYSAILVDISTEDERDAVSARGWAFGYLGGGLLLLVNLVVVLGNDVIGISTETAVRASMLSAAVWWAAFTVIPFRGLRDREPTALLGRGAGGDTDDATLWDRSFGQLWRTLKDLRHYRNTWLFLLAYLFFNDGIQTVIYAASTYGEQTLDFDTSVLIGTILLIQFVAFGGALLFGRLAERFGGYRPIVWGVAAWIAVVVGAFFLPARNVPLFLLVAVGIGLVLGGVQALSRSFFSLLIPRGAEGEYFALYQACERGTSWFGTFLFGLMFQLTDSYRPAILALIAFFVVGGLLLLRVDPRRGIEAAGNAVPASLRR